MLGMGSFGEVALAIRRSDKEEVAIKFISDTCSGIIEARNTLREISILSQFT